MSSTSPADEHKSEVEIPSTPTVKLAGFLKKESVIDGSPLELDSNPPKEDEVINFGFRVTRVFPAVWSAPNRENILD